MTKMEMIGELENVQKKLIKEKKLAEVVYTVSNSTIEIKLIKYNKKFDVSDEIDYFLSTGQNDIYQKCVIGKLLADCKA